MLELHSSSGMRFYCGKTCNRNPSFECNRERSAEINLRNVQLEEGEEFEEEDGRAVYSSQARAARNQLHLIGILDLQI